MITLYKLLAERHLKEGCLTCSALVIREEPEVDWA